MRDRGLLHGLLIGASVLLLFSILLTVANISRYKGKPAPGAGSVSRPAQPAPPAPSAEPAAEPEAPAEPVAE